MKTLPAAVRLLFFEILFGCPADGTCPAIRYIIPGSAGGNPAAGITFGGVIYIAAQFTYPFVHNLFLL
jgi:protein gp37